MLVTTPIGSGGRARRAGRLSRSCGPLRSESDRADRCFRSRSLIFLCYRGEKCDVVRGVCVVFAASPLPQRCGKSALTGPGPRSASAADCMRTYSCMLLHAAMPHIAPAILKRRGGFSGTPKRPPLWNLGTGIGRDTSAIAQAGACVALAHCSQQQALAARPTTRSSSLSSPRSHLDPYCEA
eukprot:COSAG06_NODE_100_length_24132_cov_93.237507_15_plen_182_part_00